jgi:PIN domain nuclease of toxin-antitoxin system
MHLTDTHSLLYYANQRQNRLGKNARRIFQRAEAGKSLIMIPTVVLWEVSQRLKDGTLTLTMNFDQWCRGLNDARGFSITPLEWEDVNEARRFRFRDPFDCLIAGTAARLGMPLITRDAELCESGLIETVW